VKENCSIGSSNKEEGHVIESKTVFPCFSDKNVLGIAKASSAEEYGNHKVLRAVVSRHERVTARACRSHERAWVILREERAVCPRGQAEETAIGKDRVRKPYSEKAKDNTMKANLVGAVFCAYLY
jgi:hypothetical protein